MSIIKPACPWEQFIFVGAKRMRHTVKKPLPPHASTPKHATQTPEPARTLQIPKEVASPFVASKPGKWREKYASVCAECFEARQHCLHHPERQLRLLFIGHNPSEHAWTSGNYYSNPTNRMWKLLRLGRIIPEDFTPDDNNRIPDELGIGFTDLGTEPGNDANSYKRATMKLWRSDLYLRLQAHLDRVALWHQHETNQVVEPLSCAPRVVAFTGKRQYAQLFDPPRKSTPSGPQPADQLPPNWPFPNSIEVWVLPSSSGRAVIPKDELEGVYKQLGARINEFNVTQKQQQPQQEQ